VVVITGKQFGKYVSEILQGHNPLERDGTVSHKFSNVVMTNIDML